MSFTASEDRCCHPHLQEARLKAHLIIELQQPASQNPYPHKNDVCIMQGWRKKQDGSVYSGCCQQYEKNIRHIKARLHGRFMLY